MAFIFVSGSCFPVACIHTYTHTHENGDAVPSNICCGSVFLSMHACKCARCHLSYTGGFTKASNNLCLCRYLFKNQPDHDAACRRVPGPDVAFVFVSSCHVSAYTACIAHSRTRACYDCEPINEFSLILSCASRPVAHVRGCTL